jgi:uncharacterized protein (TIGR02118 family)
MGLLQKRPELSALDFRRHWRDSHGALAAQLPGLRRYHQNHVVERAQRGIDYARGPHDIDGFSELWFDDVPSMSAAFATEKTKELSADEARFIGNLKLITAIQHVVVDPPRALPLVKRMSTLKRCGDVSSEQFLREWFDVHSMLVKRLPEVRGYRQNFIFDRAHGRGSAASYEDLPIDGVVELWFENTESIDAAFASDAGKTLMVHASEFIAEISTFLVETHEIV